MNTLHAHRSGMSFISLVLCAALAGCATHQAVESMSAGAPGAAGGQPLQVHHVTLHHDQPDKLLVAIRSLDAQDRELFAALLAEGGSQVQVPIDDRRLNPRVSARLPSTLVTMGGAHALGPAEALYLARGAGEDHVHQVVPRPEQAVIEPLAVVVFTTGALPADLSLRAPSSLEAGHARWGDGVEHARAVIADAAADLDGRGLARALRPEEDVRVVPGRFGGGRAYAVTVTVPLRDEEADDAPFEEGLDGYLSALFFLDAEGRVVGEVPELSSFNHLVIDALADLDGDGIDEIIYTSSYFEGMYVNLLQRRGDAAVITLLAGDGA